MQLVDQLLWVIHLFLETSVGILRYIQSRCPHAIAEGGNRLRDDRYLEEYQQSTQVVQAVRETAQVIPLEGLLGNTLYVIVTAIVYGTYIYIALFILGIVYEKLFRLMYRPARQVEPERPETLYQTQRRTLSRVNFNWWRIGRFAIRLPKKRRIASDAMRNIGRYSHL